MTSDRLEKFQESFLRQAREQDWPAIAARTERSRHDWASAAQGLTEQQAPAGPQDGDWSPWHLCNHVGAWLANAANAFERAAQAQSTHLGSDQAWTNGQHSLADLQTACDRAWDRFSAALPQSDPNDEAIVITHRIFGDLTSRQFAVFALSHLEAHVGQMRELRGSAAASEGSS